MSRGPNSLGPTQAASESKIHTIKTQIVPSVVLKRIYTVPGTVVQPNNLCRAHIFAPFLWPTVFLTSATQIYKVDKNKSGKLENLIDIIKAWETRELDHMNTTVEENERVLIKEVDVKIKGTEI